MAATVNVKIAREYSRSKALQRDRYHEPFQRLGQPSSQIFDMTADHTVAFPRKLEIEEDWADPDADDDDDSSATSNTTHIGVTRRSYFPPLLPTANSSSSISKSLPQRLAATISAVEPAFAQRSKSAHRTQSPAKSQSPSNFQRRRIKSPPPPQFQNAPFALTRPIDIPDPSNRPPQLAGRVPPAPFNLDEAGPDQSGHFDREGKSPRQLSGSSITDTYSSENSREFEDDEEETEPGSVDDVDDAESNSSHIPESRALQRLEAHFAKLRSRRTALWETFDGIRSKRSQVQDLRHEKDQADLAFMKAVQAILPDNQGLDQLYRNMQGAKLRCQDAEQRFDDMIDELQYGEAELESEERRFYTAAAGTSSVTSDDSLDDDNFSKSDEKWELRGISGDRPEDIHPLFEEFREACRDLQLAKELLANTQMKRRALSARKSQSLTETGLDQLRKHGDAGMKRASELEQSELMTEEDMEELEEYDGLERKAVADIDYYTKTVKLLEKECLEKDIMPKFTPFRQEGFGFDPVHRDEIHLGAEIAGRDSNSKEYPQSLTHPVFPILLSNPTHLLEEFPQTPKESLRMAVLLPDSYSPKQRHVDDAAREVNMHSLLDETRGEDKSDYINRWMLHKLHVSPMEAELLWSTFRLRLKILDIDRWQRDVLMFWWRDQAANLPSSQFEGIYEGHSLASVNPTNDHLSRALSDSGQLDHLKLWDVGEAWP